MQCRRASRRGFTVIHALVVVSLAASTLACALFRSGAPEPAPLESAKQEELRQTLAGHTWRHTHTARSVNGPRQPLLSAQIEWSFRENGTMTYDQKTVVSGTNSGQWHLEGRNIIIKGLRGNKTVAYRVEEWGDAEMTWFNYRLGDYYIVRNIGVADMAMASPVR